MVEVVCDTDFLIHLSTNRIRNMDSIGTEIGELEFVVPEAVRTELERLLQDTKKEAMARAALKYAEDLRTIPVTGEYADGGIAKYSRSNRCMVATLDRRLKKKLKLEGGTILSLCNDMIVLEPQDDRKA